MPPAPRPAIPRRALRAAAAALVLAPLFGACSGDPFPGDQEEVRVPEDDVPEVVRDAARRICGLLGEVYPVEWYWDREDRDWEVKLVGLPRKAELDLSEDGLFRELELVHTMEEVETVAPHVAEFIREKSRGEPGVVAELSLRREGYLAPLLPLEEAWKLSGVVLEFQCPNGRDFEVDPREKYVRGGVHDVDPPQ